MRSALTVIACVAAVAAVGDAGASLRNAQIVFARSSSDFGRESLFVMASDGSHLRLLASNAGTPAVSPDARSIAFVRDDAIWVMRRDGSDQRQLTAPEAQFKDFSPAWSADGATVYFSRFLPLSENASLFSVHSDGTGFQRLTNPVPTAHGHCHENAAPSPGGRIVAYDTTTDCEHGDNTSIKAVTPGGKPVTLPFRFLTTVDIQFDPAWGPNGSLAYAAMDTQAFSSYPQRTGASGIYVSSREGARPRRVTQGMDDGPEWSGDGAWIVYEHEVLTGDYPGDIWLVRADGTAGRALTRTSAYDSEPAWLPPSR